MERVLLFRQGCVFCKVVGVAQRHRRDLDALHHRVAVTSRISANMLPQLVEFFANHSPSFVRRVETIKASCCLLEFLVDKGQEPHSSIDGLLDLIVSWTHDSHATTNATVR